MEGSVNMMQGVQGELIVVDGEEVLPAEPVRAPPVTLLVLLC